MEFALNKNGQRIRATKGSSGYCEIREKLLRPKVGEIKRPHWAHIKQADCDSFHEREKQWHREWKERFPVEYREVVIKKEGLTERHRADVSIPDGDTLGIKLDKIASNGLLYQYTKQAKQMKKKDKLRESVLCRLHGPTGQDMDIFVDNNQVQIAKSIANKFSKQLGFVNRAALEVSAKRGELEIVGDGSGFCHFHHRKDGQTTIYSIAVEASEQGKGWGRLLLFRVICSAIEAGNKFVVSKCPVDEIANGFYKKQGFSLKEVLPGKKRALNVWGYKISNPLLFYCGDGGTGPFGRIATEVGWLPGFRSDKANPNIRVWFIDNHWQNYCHENHLKVVKHHKPLLATACDIEDEKDLPEIIIQAKELSEFCGRVLLIPKIKFNYDLIDFPFWWGFSVPTKYGGTQVECNWFQGRPVHLLGGSPRAQAEFAKHLNVASIDGNVATKMAQMFGKAIWQNNSGVQVSDGCYGAFRMSLEEQKKWWQNRQCWKWEDEPLAAFTTREQRFIHHR